MQRAAGLSAAEPSSFSLFASYKKEQLAGSAHFVTGNSPTSGRRDIPNGKFAVTLRASARAYSDNLVAYEASVRCET